MESMTESGDACKAIRLLIDAYHDGELENEERQRVDEHLHSCSGCRLDLHFLEAVTDSLKSLPRLGLDRDLADTLDFSQAIRQARGRRESPVFLFAALTAAAAALVFMLVLASTLTSNNKHMAEGEPVDRSRQERVARLPELREIQSKPSAGPATPNSLSKAVLSGAKNGDRLAPQVAAVPSLLQRAAPEKVKQAHPAEQDEGGKIRFDDEEPVEIAVLSDDFGDTFAESIGLQTDEDGLYVLKM